MDNPKLNHLHQYPFERLAQLKNDLTGNSDYNHISLSIGEPRNQPPEIIYRNLLDRELLKKDIGSYPKVRGEDFLREAISSWISLRFNIKVDPSTQILPVLGTREALFSVAQALLSGSSRGKVLLPNPFYQIYEGAALLANAQPCYIPSTPENDYIPNFEEIDKRTWKHCELLYLCSPGNPTGKNISIDTLCFILEKAHEYDFLIAADECYSEIYYGDPPASLLEAAKKMGDETFKRCLIFHSLSKRSNLPGLRSGFVAGDQQLIEAYLKYRTYHGCAMPLHHQRVSADVWADEEHVRANRKSYNEKFDAVTPIIETVADVVMPEGGFYHWLKTPFDDQKFAKELFTNCNITVLPGSFLGREANLDGSDGGNRVNPGRNHVRIAWVDEPKICIAAANRIADWWRRL
tara:strand:+ start:519 stop:1736 length:1218 start_codon:yes stop_codon:yes gene_type:complete